MKNKIKKILTFIGFVVVVISTIIYAMSASIPTDEYGMVDVTIFLSIGQTLLVAFLPAIFAICFIFSGNKTLNNFGYAISAINLANAFIYFASYDLMITAIGLIIMSLASVLYFIEIVFAFFGYVLNKTKGCEACEEGSSDFSEVEKYSQMLADGIITEEEYASLKAKIFAVGKKKGSNSIEDLKKWKKLYDKKLISDEEFASIKTKILK